MKTNLKRALFLMVMVCAAMIANAQTMQEVIYLKNGSIIKGIIIEQIPNVSLKVQMADGSIFVYQMDEVEKIAKENVENSHHKIKIDGSRLNGRRGLTNGYRGFVDVGYTVGTGDWGVDRIEFSTSHGYQVCPYFFAGIGAGVHYYYDSEEWGIPIFADFRSDILNNSITPFVDFKVGYTVCDAKGFYTTVSVGCRFAMKYKSGFNIGIGYTAQKVDAWWFNTVNTGGISFKVGFDF